MNVERTVRLFPAGTGEIRVIAGNATERWMNLVEASVLSPAASGVPEQIAQVTRDGGYAVIWSGSHAQLDGGELFEDDPRTWGPKGWQALESGLAALGNQARGVIVRTHARHVVGDVPGCKRFLDGAVFRNLGVRLLVDAAGTVTEDMLRRRIAEDHLRRVHEQLTDMLDGGISLDLLAGVVLASTKGTGAVPLSEGDPGCTSVVVDCARHLPEGTNLVILDRSDWPA